MVYCEDLESLNGTYVNDNLIGRLNYRRPPCLLSDGDVIAIKPDWKFRFHQPGTSPCPQEGGRNKDLEVDFSAAMFPYANIRQYFAARFAISNRVLGEGQYGTVHLATEVATSMQVACKVVNRKASVSKLSTRSTKHPHQPNEYVGDRIMREIQILKALSHVSEPLDIRTAEAHHKAKYNQPQKSLLL